MMISFQYLQLTAALQHAAGAAAAEWGQGQFSNAIAQAQRAAARGGEAAVAALHGIGDAHLLCGEPEEAEEAYRRAVKAGAQLAHAQAWSCRAAGLQALFRHRLETAAACFHKLAHEAGANTALRLEGGVLAALVFHETGARALARQLLRAAFDAARAANQPGWLRLAQVLAHDFNLRADVQQMPALSDDIHWKSIADEGRVTLDAAPAADAPAHGAPEAPAWQPLLQREAQLRLLRELAEGRVKESLALQPGLRAISPQLGAQCRDVLVLELAQAAIAAGNASVAEILLSQVKTAPAGAQAIHATGAQRQRLHCVAALRLLQNRFDEGLASYQAYAAAAMQFMREHQGIAQRFTAPLPTGYAAVNDEISARLPARYRRAYQYMVAQLHRADLSIAEVAQTIGVSERALQLAFREYVDLAPREVLRSLRMHRIHDALQAGDGESGLMEVAMRFGVQNRTSLVSGYRRYFEETPSATASRGG